MTEGPLNNLNFSSALSREIVPGKNFRVLRQFEETNEVSFNDFLTQKLKVPDDSVMFDNVQIHDNFKNNIKYQKKATPDIVSFIDDLPDYQVNSKGLGIEQLHSEESDTTNNLVKNPQTPLSVIKSVIYNRNTPLETLVSVTSNKRAVESKEISLFLAKEMPHEVKLGLAINQSTNSEALQALIYDNDWRLRKLVAEHRSVPEKLLQVLAIDPDERVRITVAENLKAAADKTVSRILANDKSSPVKVKLSQNPDTSRQALEILAKDQNIFIRIILAESPFIEQNILDSLSEDKEWTVRKTVALNTSTPLNILEKLANDNNPMVRKAVFENPGSAKLIYGS